MTTQVTKALPSEKLRRIERDKLSLLLFWTRMGKRPDFRGTRVLELGFGSGLLCAEAARGGADKVLGLDLKGSALELAQAYLDEYHWEVSSKVELRLQEISQCEDSGFDTIVSKDTFEHLLDLDGTLQEMKKRLKPGGRIYAGFGPLYPSPYGDHACRRNSFAPWGWRGQILAAIPWGHLFLEKQIISMHNSQHPWKAETMRDFGLNGLSVDDYGEAFERAGLQVLQCESNQSERLSSRVLSWLARIPVLRPYCIHNLYCILEKTRD